MFFCGLRWAIQDTANSTCTPRLDPSSRHSSTTTAFGLGKAVCTAFLGNQNVQRLWGRDHNQRVRCGLPWPRCPRSRAHFPSNPKPNHGTGRIGDVCGRVRRGHPNQLDHEVRVQTAAADTCPGGIGFRSRWGLEQAVLASGKCLPHLFLKRLRAHPCCWNHADRRVKAMNFGGRLCTKEHRSDVSSKQHLGLARVPFRRPVSSARFVPQTTAILETMIQSSHAPPGSLRMLFILAHAAPQSWAQIREEEEEEPILITEDELNQLLAWYVDGKYENLVQGHSLHRGRRPKAPVPTSTWPRLTSPFNSDDSDLRESLKWTR